MGKQLTNLRWKPYWVSHLGCVQGCLQLLGVPASDGWLFGGTGHAFVMNMAADVCPSGPTAWNTEMLFSLAPNLGYAVDGLFAVKHQPDFKEKQRQAWEQVRAAIDEGLPSYGWELGIPEFYVITGYDDTGYYYNGVGAEGSQGPKPWTELGETEIGIIEMYTVRPGSPADNVKTVREALGAALKHAREPGQWVFERYHSGLAGFDAWISAVENGTMHPLGMAFNSAVWHECRTYAVQFLEEAKARLDDGLGSRLDDALGHYRVVAAQLDTVAKTFPFHGHDPAHVEDAARRQTALIALRAAREAETAGLDALAALHTALS